MTTGAALAATVLLALGLGVAVWAICQAADPSFDQHTDEAPADPTDDVYGPAGPPLTAAELVAWEQALTSLRFVDPFTPPHERRPLPAPRPSTEETP